MFCTSGPLGSPFNDQVQLLLISIVALVITPLELLVQVVVTA